MRLLCLLVILIFCLFACQDNERTTNASSEPQKKIQDIVDADVYSVTNRKKADGPKILVVVAHPDDECSFAATLYKTSTHLNGAVDIAMITNGEGGFKYSTLAEAIYGRPLSDEEVGRMNLPAIRRNEFINGCKIMYVRDVYMFMEKDHRYTQDTNEILGKDAKVWNIERIQNGLHKMLVANNYDFVFVHMPVPTTHAHHKCATILALRAVQMLDAEKRPVIMASRGHTIGVEMDPFTGLDEFPITKLMEGKPHVFDRTQPFGYKERLNYKIIVNWVIAEHKSQGTMQLAMHKGDQEWYYPFAVNNKHAHEKAAALFKRLEEPQFETKTYGFGGGTDRKKAEELKKK